MSSSNPNGPRANGGGVPFIAFDCDGTLVDSQHSIVAAASAAFRAEGREAPDAAFIRAGVGLPLDMAIARLAPDADHTGVLRLIAAWRQAYFDQRQKKEVEEPLYPGAREAVEKLDDAGAVLGVITMKSRRGLLAVLERHGLMPRFPILKSADDGPGKPDPTMLNHAMQEAGATPSTSVMIGDTSYDIEMACAAGVTAIGVGWGYHPVDELRAAGATHIAQSYSDLSIMVADMLDIDS